MRRPDPTVWIPAGVAALVSAALWGAWVITHALAWLILAMAVQAVSGLVIAAFAERDRRALLVVLAIEAPIAGPLAAAWVQSLRSRGDAALFDSPRASHLNDHKIAHQLTETLPPCEAIVSPEIEVRRATLSHLAQRASVEDIAILRWARDQRSSDIAVEAALALEEIEQRFDVRLHDARAAAERAPSYETHAAVLDTICDGVVTGIVDTALVAKLAAQARTHHESALACDPSAAPRLALSLARLELAARAPAAALQVLSPAIGTSANPRLAELHAQAAYAARRFELVPELAPRRHLAG